LGKKITGVYFTWQKRHSARRFFSPANRTKNLGNKLMEFYTLSTVLSGVETWTLRKTEHTLKVLKYGAAEGWRRPVGLIV
jgi:hypothetical protein